MRFASTRNIKNEVSFREAIFQGLAPDGGLFHPTSACDLRDLFKSFPQSISYNQLAEEISYELFLPELSRDSIHRIIERAYNFSPKLTRLDHTKLILELFHGPSYAFKDFGACFLASCMEEFLSKEDKKAVILVATSGDTGSAVAKAFYKKSNINVVILYPSGRVSPLQEKQLTTIGENIKALEVKGSFDDCQRMAKEAFMDKELRNALNLTSANSINLGRLIPQSYYYIYAYTQLKEEHKGDFYFTVPSGNFGNLTAGVYAWLWGLPVKGFIAATNINDVVPDYLKSGIFCPRPSLATLSNAMDVGNPSNFERLKTIFKDNVASMRSIIYEEVVTDKDTLKTMKEVKDKFNIYIDPHTSVGYLGSMRFLLKNSKIKNSKVDNSEIDNSKLKNNTQNYIQPQIVILSTAHAAKFSETVKQATGEEPVLPQGLKDVLSLPKQSVLIDNTLDHLKTFLLKQFA